jgi:hypothetical protein
VRHSRFVKSRRNFSHFPEQTVLASRGGQKLTAGEAATGDRLTTKVLVPSEGSKAIKWERIILGPKYRIMNPPTLLHTMPIRPRCETTLFVAADAVGRLQQCGLGLIDAKIRGHQSSSGRISIVKGVLHERKPKGPF